MSFLRRLPCRTFSTAAQVVPGAKSLAGDLYKERNLRRLVEKFKKGCENDRFRTKNGIYVDTVRRLAAARRFLWIEEILEDQKKYPNICKEGFAARLIRLYGKAGMFDHANKVFDEMPNRSLLPFNALLGACLNSKKLDKVSELFQELPRQLSIEPDVVAYNTVIKAFVEMGSVDSASLMFEEMQRKGLTPDLITFNTLLDGFYKKGLFVDGEKIWDRMVENNVAPDVRSYSIKLLGLAMEKGMSEAVQLIDEMQSNAIKPDIFSFNSVISGFVKEGNLEEAKQWYVKMKENSYTPDKMTFKILVPFLCERGDLGFAVELCEEIFSCKRLVDRGLLQQVVDELFKHSMIEEAKKLVHLSEESNNYCRYKLKLPSQE